jgi:hypothetical protein
MRFTFRRAARRSTNPGQARDRRVERQPLGGVCGFGEGEGFDQPTSDWQVLFRQSFQLSTPDKRNSCSNPVNAMVEAKANIREWK